MLSRRLWEFSTNALCSPQVIGTEWTCAMQMITLNKAKMWDAILCVGHQR